MIDKPSIIARHPISDDKQCSVHCHMRAERDFLSARLPLLTIGSTECEHSSWKWSRWFNQFWPSFSEHDAMWLLTLILVVSCQPVRSALTTDCQANATVWTYYPCSFLVSSPSSSCSAFSTRLSIDQCIDGDAMVFWHFPLGNLTLTLYSEENRSFSIRLLTRTLWRKRFLRNIYHLINDPTREERLFSDMEDDSALLHSDISHQCSIKFETDNSIIFDYGLFIPMLIAANA